jgi:hypothetical protein
METVYMSIEEVRQLRLEKLLKAQEISKVCELYVERICLYTNLADQPTPTLRLDHMINNVDMLDNFRRDLQDGVTAKCSEMSEIGCFLREAEKLSKDADGGG